LVERYCLLGEDVSGSPTPAVMNAAFRATGIDASYEAISVGRDEFVRRFLELRETVEGFNLTIPYKADVIGHLDWLDPVASRIRAVNVVKKAGHRHLGYNSDVDGITGPLREHGIEHVGRALLLGAGGAARAFCDAMNQLGCAKVTIAVRDVTKGKSFAMEMAAAFPRMVFATVELGKLVPAEAEVVFNATPMGSPGVPLSEALKRVIYGHATVFDAVYRPTMTELLKTAEERGSRIIYGYEMLLDQGTKGFEIWTGMRAPKEVMRTALLESLERGP
jgi:shikimate dehydrogenase